MEMRKDYWGDKRLKAIFSEKKYCSLGLFVLNVNPENKDFPQEAE